MESKVCTKCGRELPATDQYFPKHGNGFEGRCKECRKKYQKTYYEDHKEKINAHNRAYAEAHKEKIKEYQKTYKEANKERLKEHRKAYREANHDDILSREREYRKSHRSEDMARCREYYATHKESISAQAKLYRQEHKEEIAERQKRYHEENREKIAERQKRYREQHKEHLAEKTREYYILNRDRLNAYRRNYAKEHPCYEAEIKRRRRSRKHSLLADFTDSQWDHVQEVFQYSCAYCGSKPKILEREHFVPVICGGHYTASNIVPACRTCNASKSTKLFSDWYPTQPFYSPEREAKILNYIKEVSTVDSEVDFTSN